jgi:hypothetical protein
MLRLCRYQQSSAIPRHSAVESGCPTIEDATTAPSPEQLLQRTETQHSISSFEEYAGATAAAPGVEHVNKELALETMALYQPHYVGVMNGGDV